MKSRPHRIVVCASMDPAVVAALRKQAEKSGQPFSRVVEAAAVRGLGLPEREPMLPAAPVDP